MIIQVIIVLMWIILMKIHEAFPILVAQDKIDIHDEIKNEYLEELKPLWWNGYENRTPEHSGRCSIHKDPKYLRIFESINRSVRRYLDLLEVDHEKLFVNITKSWLGYANKETPQLKMHYHNDADISFCYYLLADETSDKFCVYDPTFRNEPGGGIFEAGENYNMIKKFNKYNCDKYIITPEEGTILLFPSKMNHCTLKKENLEDRYSLIGDIKLCLKPEYNLYPQSCPHHTLWLEL